MNIFFYGKKKRREKRKRTESYPPSNAPATSAEIKKGEFAKTSLRKTHTLIDVK